MEEVIYNNQRIIDVWWFDGCGIVKTQDIITNKIKIYIGSSNCMTEWESIEYIIDLGTKLSEERIKEILKTNKGEK